MTLGATSRGDVGASPARKLGDGDALVFDDDVVPRYLALFGERLMAMVTPSPEARVCHVACRTGYPDVALLQRLPGAEVFGCDPSEPAVARARKRAGATPGFSHDYRVDDGYPTPFPDGAFSHAYTLHPLAAPEERRRLLEELARLVAPRGQALVAMPLRGSFAEVADLLRECALKLELPDLTASVEAAVQLRPSEEMLASELAKVGFDHVETDVRSCTLRFESGSAFFDDPVTRLILLPEFRVNLAMEDERPFSYVREAIDKYWSGVPFELSVTVGCVSGRRKG